MTTWSHRTTRNVYTIDPPLPFEAVYRSGVVQTELRWVQIEWWEDDDSEPMVEVRASTRPDGEGGTVLDPRLNEAFADLIEQTRPKEAS